AAPTRLLPSQGLPPHQFGDLAQHRGDYCHRSDSGSLTPQSSCNDVAYRLVRTRFTRQIGHGPIRGSLPRVSCTGPRVTAVSARVTLFIRSLDSYLGSQFPVTISSSTRSGAVRPAASAAKLMTRRWVSTVGATALRSS